MAQRTHLFRVKFVEEDARRVAILADHVLRGFDYRLSGPCVFVFGGDDHEPPRSQMLQKVVVLTRLRLGPIAPGKNQMRESVASEIRRIEEVELVSRRI